MLGDQKFGSLAITLPKGDHRILTHGKSGEEVELLGIDVYPHLMHVLRAYFHDNWRRFPETNAGIKNRWEIFERVREKKYLSIVLIASILFTFLPLYLPDYQGN